MGAAKTGTEPRVYRREAEPRLIENTGSPKCRFPGGRPGHRWQASRATPCAGGAAAWALRHAARVTFSDGRPTWSVARCVFASLSPAVPVIPFGESASAAPAPRRAQHSGNCTLRVGLVGHGAVARFAAAEYRRLPDVTITAVAGKHVLVEKPLATTHRGCRGTPHGAAVSGGRALACEADRLALAAP